MEAQDDADRRLDENVAAAAVQAAPAHAKKAKKAAAEAVRAVSDEMKGEVAAAAVRAVPDEMKGEVAAAAVQAAPDKLEGEVAAAAVQSVVNSKESERNDLRKVVSESIQSSMAEVLRRPVVSNVQGSLCLSAGPESADRLELTVTIATGPAAWQDAAGHPTARAFRLTGGEDRPNAPFEIAVDAPGLQVDPTQTSLDLSTSGGSHEWSFSVPGDRMDEMPIWVTLYSSGRYVQAIKWPTEPKDQGDGHG